MEGNDKAMKTRGEHQKERNSALVWVLYVITCCIIILTLYFSIQSKRRLETERSDAMTQTSTWLAAEIHQRFELGWDLIDSIALELSSISTTTPSDLKPFLNAQKELWKIQDITLTFRKYITPGDTITTNTETPMEKRLELTGESAIYTLPLENSNIIINQFPLAGISLTFPLSDILTQARTHMAEDDLLLMLNEDGQILLSSRDDGPFGQNFIDSLNSIPITNAGTGEKTEIKNADGIITGLYNTTFNGVLYQFSLLSIDAGTAPLYIVYLTGRSSYPLFPLIALVILAVALVTYVHTSYLADQKMLSQSLKTARSHASSIQKLFAILVSSASDAYYILKDGSTIPVYRSPNAQLLFPELVLGFHQSEKGLTIIGSGISAKSKAGLEAELRCWSGKGSFTSSPIPLMKNTIESTSYFRITLSSPEENTYLAVLSDFTKDQNNERILKDALSAANEAENEKSKFLANLAHDVKTPMTSIIGMTGFALDELSDTVKVKGYLENISSASNKLVTTLDALFDMNRLESGNSIISAKKCDLSLLLSKLESQFAPLAKDKGQTLIFSVNIQHPHIIGDGQRITQILANLLQNAISFTPDKGRIELIAIEQEAEETDAISYHFTVLDTGVGIPRDKLSSIFIPFSKNVTEGVHTEGCGLGLSIAKSFVEAMHGSISAQSALGSGSAFSVELTLPTDTAPEIKEEAKAIDYDFTGKTILIAEDHPLNMAIIKKLVANTGATTITADNGKVALERFSASAPGQISAILMDIQMPIMDGLDATRKIRMLDREDVFALPIIALSASVFAEDVKKSKEAGMNAHIGKPIKKEELYATLSSFLYGKDSQNQQR